MSQKLPVILAGMLVQTYYCLWCGKKVKGFRDQQSAREFKITKTCQACQDKQWQFGD